MNYGSFSALMHAEIYCGNSWEGPGASGKSHRQAR